MIPPSLFSKWYGILCEDYVLGFERSYCPNRNCMALVVNECERKGTLKKARCPNSKRWFCFRCSRIGMLGTHVKKLETWSGTGMIFCLGVLQRVRIGLGVLVVATVLRDETAVLLWNAGYFPHFFLFYLYIYIYIYLFIYLFRSLLPYNYCKVLLSHKVGRKVHDRLLF